MHGVYANFLVLTYSNVRYAHSRLKSNKAILILQMVLVQFVNFYVVCGGFKLKISQKMRFFINFFN